METTSAATAFSSLNLTTSSGQPVWIHAVRLAGRRSLLGAEKVTWRFTRTGVCVVSGSNGSGKTLLCSALCAAMYPEANAGLVAGLRDAGIDRITVRVSNGDEPWTHSLDLSADEWRGPNRITDLADLPSPHLHWILNGEWREPDSRTMEWAGTMNRKPLLRERELWISRAQGLLNGQSGGCSPEELRAQIAALEEEREAALSLRRDYEEAMRQRERVSLELQEQIMRRQILDLESSELTRKIEIAERAARLQEWYGEIDAQRRTVEERRAKYEALQEELDRVRSILNGLPDFAEARAQRYRDLQTEIAGRFHRQEELARERGAAKEQLQALLDLRGELALQSAATDETPRHELAHKLAEAESQLTELHRARIDLLRKNDGLHRTMSESLRDISSLLPGEITMLREYAESLDEPAVSTADVDAGELKTKLEGVRKTLREYAGYENLPADAEEQVKALYAAREFATLRMAESEALKNRMTLLQGGKQTGAKIGLSVMGAAAAGIPAWLSLGMDIGFFAGLVGGGLGYGLARLISRSQERELAIVHDQSEHCGQELASSLSTRDNLKRVLRPLAGEDSAMIAIEKLHRYRDLLIAERELTQQLQQASRAVPLQRKQPEIPSAFRSIEKADILSRIGLYDAARREIETCAHELLRYERGGDMHHRATDLEAAIQTYELELRDWDDQASRSRHETADDLKGAEVKIGALQHKLSILEQEIESAGNVSDLEGECARLNAECGGKLETPGADAVLAAAANRLHIEEQLREVKQQLTHEHSWQELAARAAVIDEERREIVERVRVMDPLFAERDSIIADLLKYRAQLDELTAQSESGRKLENSLQKQLNGFDVSALETEVGRMRSEEAIAADLFAATAKHEESERSVSAARRMIETLDAEISEQEQQCYVRTLQHLQKCVFETAGERVVSVDPVNDTWEATLEDGSRKPLSRLPRGLAELVRLSLTFGVLKWSACGELLPIFWDDVCSQLDDLHLESARRMVHALESERQVILFSRDARIRAWGGAPEVLVGEHEFELIA